MHLAQNEFERIGSGLNMQDRPIDLSDIQNRLGGMTTPGGPILSQGEEKGEAVSSVSYQKYIDVLQTYLGSTSETPFAQALMEIKRRYPDAAGLTVQKLSSIYKAWPKK
jgi:hypothetical protein